jgi:hypothetical protein
MWRSSLYVCLSVCNPLSGPKPLNRLKFDIGDFYFGNFGFQTYRSLRRPGLQNTVSGQFRVFHKSFN